MAASTLSSVAFIYKRLYMSGQPGDLAMRDHPLLNKLRKEGKFTGSAFHYPIRYTNPQGIAEGFSDAQTAAASSKGVQMQANRRGLYGVITLDGEAMAASEGDKGAFLNLVRQETEGVLEEHGDTLAFQAYRGGTSVLGQRSSESTDVTTLVTADDARNFKVGMTVFASPNADATSPRTGSTTITSVDEDAGTIGLDTSDITSYADSDYLFRLGSAADGAMEGLAAHFPLTAPSTSDSFRGVNRSADARRLAGVRVNDTATSIEENAGLVAVKIGQVGKKADCLWLNPIRFWEVVRRLNAKVEYDSGGKSAAYAFEYFKIHTPAGVVKAYSDPDCPTNRGYVCNMRTLFIKHLRGLPHIISDDGRPNLRSTTEDAIEARSRSWCNLVVTEPGSNGVFAI